MNLHPDLNKFIHHAHGLVLISGPTGCGKSTTLAALIQTINLSEARHIVTIENPIEFTFRPRRSFIRQREVGRDTPSFEQALLDSLREDPDVLMVGEMREPETMRLTLSAAETGHLVLATVHSSNCAEALQRVVGAFPAEIQNNVAAQLADCLIGVISQRLVFRPDLNICVPECEVLMSTLPIKNFIRNRDFFKIVNSVETGAEYGMWTFQRYRAWLDKRANFHRNLARSRAGGGGSRRAGDVHAPSPAAPRRAPRQRRAARPVPKPPAKPRTNARPGAFEYRDPRKFSRKFSRTVVPCSCNAQRRKICFISSVAVSRSRSKAVPIHLQARRGAGGVERRAFQRVQFHQFLRDFRIGKKLEKPLGRRGMRTIPDHAHRVRNEKRFLR